MKFVNPGDWHGKAMELEMDSQELDAWKRRTYLTPVEIAVREGTQFTAHYFLVGNSGVRMIVYEAKS